MNRQNLLLTRLLPCGGLVLGGAAWALNTQLGQTLPHADCAAGRPFTAIGASACLLAGIAGVLPSLWSLRRDAGAGRVTRFLSWLGLLGGLLFTLALLLQGAASLILGGCER